MSVEFRHSRACCYLYATKHLRCCVHQKPPTSTLFVARLPTVPLGTPHTHQQQQHPSPVCCVSEPQNITSTVTETGLGRAGSFATCRGVNIRLRPCTLPRFPAHASATLSAVASRERESERREQAALHRPAWTRRRQQPLLWMTSSMLALTIAGRLCHNLWMKAAH